MSDDELKELRLVTRPRRGFFDAHWGTLYITRNEIPLNEDIAATFKQLFEAVKKLDDQPRISVSS